LILVLLFFSQIGYQFIYLIQQHELKEQAEAQLLSTINDDQFEQINQDDNFHNIVWEEEGKEFSLNGKTILYCLYDKKEEQLLKEMIKKENANADNTPGNKDDEHSIKFQVSDFTEPAQNTFFTTIENIQPCREYASPVRSVIKEVNTPPPNNNLYSQTLIL